MNPTRFPLQWPPDWKRTPSHRRRDGTFSKYKKSISVAQAVDRLRAELGRMAIHEADIVISTNVELRLDGFPRSDRAAPSDVGAAVYWLDRGQMRCMAIDQYTKVEQNIAALAATIEAMRAIERHGGAMVLERAFVGFAALPAPGAARTWRVVLGFDNHHGAISAELLRERYRSRASQNHPDKGGSDSEMAEVNRAYEDAKRELGHG